MESKIQERVQPLKVSIGAGDVRVDGFIRVDIDPNTQPDRVMDVRKLEFAPQSVDVLYASHVLEHFNFESDDNKSVRWSSVVSLLKSWKECLTPNGCLYLCVPDLEQLARILLEFHEDEDIQKTVLDTIYGGARNSFDIHYSGFTKTLLTSLLKQAGFHEVKTFDSFANDESSHKIAGKPISLNLVAYNGPDAERSVHPERPQEQVESELQKYMRVAEERRLEIMVLNNEIAVLRHACQERLELIEKINPELAKYRKYYEDINRSWKTRVKKLVKGPTNL